MKSKFVFHLFICALCSSFFLYSYVNKQNELTKLKIAIPQVAKELQTLREKNTQLKYEIDRFENPEHLMELAREQRFSHLMHPLMNEVLMLREGIAVQGTLPASH